MQYVTSQSGLTAFFTSQAAEARSRTIKAKNRQDRFRAEGEAFAWEQASYFLSSTTFDPPPEGKGESLPDPIPSLCGPKAQAGC